MSALKISSICRVSRFLLFLIVVFNLSPNAFCVDGDDYSQTGNPALLPIITDTIYKRLSNLSVVFGDDIMDSLSFCIKNVKADWKRAFDFEGDLDFITNCIKKIKGDITLRLCTAAEIKFYFGSLFGQGTTDQTHYLKPNKNCNLSSWPNGCEPGWGCGANPNQKIDLYNSKDMPLRTRDCQPCCEGFFCPQGLTCMIPCPLGSYCPSAKLNKTTGMCTPYGYQIPPGHPNHTCGGADAWAPVAASSEIFCAPGSYCPRTTLKVPCSSGHYCRMGSTSQICKFLVISGDMETCDVLEFSAEEKGF